MNKKIRSLKAHNLIPISLIIFTISVSVLYVTSCVQINVKKARISKELKGFFFIVIQCDIITTIWVKFSMLTLCCFPDLFYFFFSLNYYSFQLIFPCFFFSYTIAFRFTSRAQKQIPLQQTYRAELLIIINSIETVFSVIIKKGEKKFNEGLFHGQKLLNGKN